MIFRLPEKVSGRKTDAELIEAFTLSGDLEILGQLYADYMHLVYGVCLKYLKNREEAMDAVMQIFEKLIYEIPRHRIENFRSWLHVVTRNYCLMNIRSAKARTEKYNEWINDPGNFMENRYEPHPVDKDQEEMDKALADCIEKLKAEQKECIKLFYFENKCYNEIAKNLELDEKKVKSHLQNGKRNLKLCLEEKNEEERQK